MRTGRAAGARFGGPCSERAGGSSAPLPGQCCPPGCPGAGSAAPGSCPVPEWGCCRMKSHPVHRDDPTAPWTRLTAYCGRLLPVPRLPCPTTCPFLSTRRARLRRRSLEASRAFPGSRPARAAITSCPAPGTCRGQGPPPSHCAAGRLAVPRVPQPRAAAALRPRSHPATGSAAAFLPYRGWRERFCPLQPPARGARSAQPGSSPPELSYLRTAVTQRAPLAGARSSTAASCPGPEHV